MAHCSMTTHVLQCYWRSTVAPPCFPVRSDESGSLVLFCLVFSGMVRNFRMVMNRLATSVCQVRRCQT